MSTKQKNAAAVSLGKRRTALLTAEERRALASLAGRARWKKQRGAERKARAAQ